MGSRPGALRPSTGVVALQVPTSVLKSPVADDVHLNGYDQSVNVKAGGTARITFHARLAGRFEVELENRGTQIADPTVEP